MMRPTRRRNATVPPKTDVSGEHAPNPALVENPPSGDIQAARVKVHANDVEEYDSLPAPLTHTAKLSAHLTPQQLALLMTQPDRVEVASRGLETFMHVASLAIGARNPELSGALMTLGEQLNLVDAPSVAR